MKIEDIRMTDEMFYNLSDAHFKVLADLGILKHIIANKGQEIQVSEHYILGNVNMCNEQRK